MLKNNELRIGNLVEWYGKPYPIIQIKENNACIEDLSNDFDQLHWLPVLSPIPLTEEWLLKFGYSITEFMGFEKGFSNGSKLHIQIMSGGVFTAFLEGDSVFVLICKLDFVHSLQNLYYSIEQKELCVDTLTRNT